MTPVAAGVGEQRHRPQGGEVHGSEGENRKTGAMRILQYVVIALLGVGLVVTSVGWYLSAFGPAVGFTMAKLFAVTCGSVLYFTARYRWVAILTLLYLIFAVGPWVGLLSNSV